MIRSRKQMLFLFLWKSSFPFKFVISVCVWIRKARTSVRDQSGWSIVLKFLSFYLLRGSKVAIVSVYKYAKILVLFKTFSSCHPIMKTGPWHCVGQSLGHPSPTYTKRKYWPGSWVEVLCWLIDSTSYDIFQVSDKQFRSIHLFAQLWKK